MIPPLFNLPPGCKFSTRCARAFETCHQAEPPLFSVGRAEDGCHLVRCWLCQGQDSATPLLEGA